MKRVNWVVGCQEGEQALRQRLFHESNYLETLGIMGRVSENDVGTVRFFGCTFEYEGGHVPDDLAGVCRHHVASAIAKAIVDYWEPSLLRRVLDLHYDYLEGQERTQIEKLALELVDQRRRSGDLFGKPHQLPPGEGQPDREVLNRIRGYLEESHLLNVEGFITFRLRDYVDTLHAIVAEAVDAFLIDREYREFVRLLRYFVDVQEPRTGRTHVFIKQGEAFAIADENGHSMDDEYLGELVAELAETEVTREDLLVSVLITLAPEKVTIHCPADRLQEEAVRTVRDVFFRRLKVCTGCKQCLKVCAESTRNDG